MPARPIVNINIIDLDIDINNLSKDELVEMVAKYLSDDGGAITSIVLSNGKDMKILSNEEDKG